jgi:hypothetical protein
VRILSLIGALIATGPMEVYLASCGSVSCDKFDASNAQWFKISEVGKRDGGWAQQDQCKLLSGLPIVDSRS